MWQLQWIVGLIPDAVLYWIYWGIIAAGLTGLFAGWLGRWIPFYGKYVQFLKPIGIALLVLGVWLKGGYDTEMSWRDRVAELEKKVKQSEQKSIDANKKLVEAIKDKNKAIQDAKSATTARLAQVQQKIDAECKIDREAIEILNDSAKQPKVKK